MPGSSQHSAPNPDRVNGAGIAATAEYEAGPFSAWQKKMVPVLFILPGLILSAFIIIYPVWELIQTSLRKVTRFGKVTKLNDFANFEAVFSDNLFQEAAIRSVWWTLLVVGGTLICAAGIALILNEKFHGRAIARVIIMLPWSVSLSLLTVVWRWALNGETGYLNHLLEQLGVIDGPVVWLASGSTAFTVMILIGIIVSIPFTTTIFLGGLSSLPGDLYEAARMEGASHWHCFKTITVPMMQPYVNIAIVLNVIYVFNSFPIIWILTEGGPANSTDILVTYLYKIAFKYGKLGEASVVSLLMFVFLLAFAALYLRLVSKDEANA
ncbi:multiple sugar transport system permease protein [Martelella radicis]|uniref:Multiple sugar transport system permease protein n=2 Tax=Martelella radicis TaxID=1397476 RepID=A0A7W6P8E8_9HYPH|nr:multiple sugar transport system permease protein [Martelella radicis]